MATQKLNSRHLKEQLETFFLLACVGRNFNYCH